MSSCCAISLNVTAAAIAGTTLQLTISPAALSDGQRYRIVVPSNIAIPVGIEALALTVLNGADVVPIWTCGPARSILGNRLNLFRSNCPAIQYIIPAEYVNTGIATNPAHFAAIRRV